MSGKQFNILAVIFIVSVLATLVFSSTPGYAYEENLLVNSLSDEISACSCGLTTNVITVTNIGSITSSYLLTLTGPAEKFITLSEDMFILKPGERKEVLEYVKIGCSERGMFELTTKVETILGNKQEVHQTFNVENCPNVQISTLTPEQQVCPGSTSKFEFNIQNTGGYDEEYEISMTPFSEYITLSQNIISIKAGEEESIFAFINPDNSFSGEVNIDFSAKARNSQILGTVPIKLIVNPCFDYLVGFDNQYSVCKNIYYEFPIKVKNDADVVNAYDINLESKNKWITTQDAGLLIFPEDIGESKVIISPGNTKAGLYDFTLEVKSERGNIEHYADAQVEVQECYKVALTSNIPELVSGESNTASVSITNLGTQNDTFYIYADGTEWMTFSSEEISLLPGETKEIQTTLDIPLDAPKKLDVRLLAISYNYNFSNSYKDITLKIIPQEKAYALDILAEDLRTNYESSTEIVKISHPGLIGSEYAFSIEGPEWVWLNETSLFLEAESKSQINLVIAPNNSTEEGTYPVTIYAAVDRVPDLTYARNFEIIVREKSLFIIVLPYLLIGIAILLIIYGLIVLARKIKSRPKKPSMPVRQKSKPLSLINIYDPSTTTPKKGRAKGFFKWLAIIIVIILILLAIGFGGYKSYNHFSSNQTTDVASDTTNTLGDTPGADNLTSDNLTSNNLNNADLDAPSSESEQPIFAVDTSYLASWGNTLYIERNVVTDIPVMFHNPSEVAVKFTLDLTSTNTPSWTDLDTTSILVEPNSDYTAYLSTTPDDFVETGTYPVVLETSYTLNGEKITEIIELNLDIGHYMLFQAIRLIIFILIGVVILAVLILIITLISKTKSNKGIKFKTHNQESKKDEPAESKVKVPKDGFWKRWTEKRRVAREKKRIRRITSQKFSAEANIHSTNIGKIEPVFVKNITKPRKRRNLKGFFKWLLAIVIILVVLGVVLYSGKTAYDNYGNLSNSLSNGITGWHSAKDAGADDNLEADDDLEEDLPAKLEPKEDKPEVKHDIKDPLFFINRTALEG
ncbi:MAG: hypothetical protein ABIH76_05465, partial [Candidatus Bathyarchaeota archaeon]